MFVFSLISSTVLGASVTWADKFTYPPQKLSARGVTEVRVSGVRGKFVLKGNHSKSYKIRVSHSKNKRFDDWSLSVDRQGGALVLEVFNVALGGQWKHSVRAEFYPEFDIEIEGPAVPATIAWREGSLSVSDWSADMEAAYLTGSFDIRRFKGQLKLQAGEGNIRISQADGHIMLKGEKGRVELSHVRAAVDLNWLQGTLRGEDLSGRLVLDLANGNAQLHGISGKLKVSGENSEWTLQARAPADLEVVTEAGPVNLRWLGGARAFLTSASGVIAVPKPFSVELRDGLKVAQFSKDKTPRGQVFVRTQSGAITWQ